MFTRIIDFYGKFSEYISGGLLILLVVSSLGWYVSNLKRDNLQTKLNDKELKLSISNSSIESLSKELQSVTKTLVDNETIEKQHQDLLSKKLKSLDEADKANLSLEDHLRNRQSNSDCKTPKDLKDAWNKL